MTPNEKSVGNDGNNPEARKLCHWYHVNEEEYCSTCEGIEIGLLSEREKVKRLTAACQRVVNDSAQDEIEDPVGHSKRWREGFERIHKNAVEQCAKALSPATEEGKP